MVKLLGWSIGVAGIVSTIPIVLGAIFPAVALYAGVLSALRDPFASLAFTRFADLLLVFALLAAHVWLAIACGWLAAKTIASSEISRPLRWTAWGAFIATLVVALPIPYDPSAHGQFFVLGYAWPALLCVAVLLVWSKLKESRWAA
jgi:hypothetical protein